MSELDKYIQDPTNDFNNFYLARWYENQKHFSPAASYYLRALEHSSNIDLQYECLLRLFHCYSALGDRDNTAETLLKQAIYLAPNKPEAYYILSQFHQYRKHWLDSYLFSELALQYNCDKSNLIFPTEYPGKFGFYFQKAAASWWLGKSQQCRRLYHYILENYINILTPDFKSCLQFNLSHLGSGPESQAFRKYTKEMHDKLRFKFSNSSNIKENFAQTYQDLFILALLDGKIQGSYLEIGSSKPFVGNNTALLETMYDWNGVGLELKQEFVDDYRKNRKNPVLCIDALEVNYTSLLQEYFPNSDVIDYLQLDIEPSKNTFEALLAIPFDKYKFRVITYEHDYYVDITKSYKDKSRRYLQSIGYELVVNDISPDDNSSFEDWWVHPDLIDPNRLNIMKNIDLSTVHHIERYMLDS
jgi:hypothetical protein